MRFRRIHPTAIFASFSVISMLLGTVFLAWGISSGNAAHALETNYSHDLAFYRNRPDTPSSLVHVLPNSPGTGPFLTHLRIESDIASYRNTEELMFELGTLGWLMGLVFGGFAIAAYRQRSVPPPLPPNSAASP